MSNEIITFESLDGPMIDEVDFGHFGNVKNQYYPPYVIWDGRIGEYVVNAKSKQHVTHSSVDGLTNWKNPRLATHISDVPGMNKCEVSVLRHDPRMGSYPSFAYFMFWGGQVGGQPNYSKSVYLSYNYQAEGTMDWPAPGYDVQPNQRPDGKSRWITEKTPVIDATKISKKGGIPLGPNGERFNWIDMTDVKRMEDGTDRLMAYCNVYHNLQRGGAQAGTYQSDKYYLCTYICKEGSLREWEFDRWILSGSHCEANNLHPLGSRLVHASGVVKVGEKYLLTFTCGSESAAHNHRAIYCGVGDNPYEFKIIKDPVLTPYHPEGWERVYGSHIVVDQDSYWWNPHFDSDGKNRKYWSGVTHEVNYPGFFPGETGGNAGLMFGSQIVIDIPETLPDHFDSDYITLNKLNSLTS